MDKIVYNPIGIVHSPFEEPKGTPIQSIYAQCIEGTVEIFPEYTDGLKDIEGFSYLFLLFHFHKSEKRTLRQKPFLDDEIRGIFSIRGPSRPNPIGISIVRLLSVEGNILHVQDLDIIDKTPLLDIKPYIPQIDIRKEGKIGWLENKEHKFSTARDDGRFSRKQKNKNN